uniref:Uncharacterized protein n=1 Tax=Timema tahoe TaxID=61484 RepID=A0A7R9II11_9NEOP|nr:unnamed protein product [Timema tahoe]
MNWVKSVVLLMETLLPDDDEEADMEEQRSNLLLRLAGKYRAVATDALCVALGVGPLDLLVKNKVIGYWKRKNNREKVRILTSPEVETSEDAEIALLREWQRRWQGIETGRRAYQLFRNVVERIDNVHLEPSPSLVFFITGNGPYPESLKKMGLVGSDLCEFCMGGAPEHIVLECAQGKNKQYALTGYINYGEEDEMAKEPLAQLSVRYKVSLERVDHGHPSLLAGTTWNLSGRLHFTSQRSQVQIGIEAGVIDSTDTCNLAPSCGNSGDLGDSIPRGHAWYFFVEENYQGKYKMYYIKAVRRISAANTSVKDAAKRGSLVNMKNSQNCVKNTLKFRLATGSSIGN